MTVSSESPKLQRTVRWELCRHRKKVWSLSSFVILLSLLGFSLCWLNPSIRLPLRPGLDFTGGTQILLERDCGEVCSTVDTRISREVLINLKLPDEKGNPAPNLLGAKVQLLDGGKSVSLKLPFLSASQSQLIIEGMNQVLGPLKNGAQSIDTIGPTLGSKLLRSSLLSLLVAFSAIAFYISFRYDRRYALLAIVALAHDVIIVCGLFAWLGLFISLEVDSLFAVALLTIAGYSVNDTVVVFDRIREFNRKDSSISFYDQIDQAVSATLTRTLYTSGTTLLPLIALIIFGGSTLYWFAIALAIGVVVGSWSSIALAPSLLSLSERTIQKG